MAEHVLLASPSFDLYPFPIWNNKCKNLLYMWCFGAFIREEPVYKPGESLLQSSVTVDSLKEQHGPYQENSTQIYRKKGSKETISIQGCPYFCPRYRRCQETGTVLVQLLSVRSFITSLAKLDPNFLGWSQMWTWFSGSTGSGLSIRFWKRVSLTSKQVQIWIHDRHVLNCGHRESLMSRI